MLDADVLPIICSFGIECAFKLALVSKEWRDAIYSDDSDFISASKNIAKLGETSLMCDLVSALRLSPTKVKEAEYTLKRRYGGGHYKIFSHDEAISLFYKNGGWGGLEKRIVTYQERCKN